MIEQHTALMRDNWNRVEPWAYSSMANTSRTLYERGTILVIDQNMTVRHWLTSLLADHGYHVVLGCPKRRFGQILYCFGPGHITLECQDCWVLARDTEVQKWARPMGCFGRPNVVPTATAEEAEAARQRIAPASIDLVITDIHLHDDAQAWEGYVLYHRWTVQQPRLPFLLMSATPCVRALSTLRYPNVRFLVKPFTQKVLLDAIAVLIKT